MTTHRRRWLILLAGVVAAVLAIVLAAPAILRWAAVRAIERSGTYDAHIGSVEIHWTRAALTVRDVRVVDLKHERTVLEMPRADVDVVASSLVHRPLRLSVSATGPKVLLIADDQKDTVARSTSSTLRRTPHVVIDRVQVEDGSLVTTSSALAQNLALDHVRIDAHDISNRPAPHGERRTRMTLDGHLSQGGHVSAALSADLLDAPTDLRMRITSHDVPLQVAAPVTEKKADVRPTGGKGDLQIEASLHDGAFEGTAQASIRNPSFAKEPGTGLGGKIKAKLADLGGKAATSQGPLERDVQFHGRLRAPRPVVTEAVDQIVHRAAKTLEKSAV